MTAHGLALDLLVELVAAGFAAKHGEYIFAHVQATRLLPDELRANRRAIPRLCRPLEAR
jgi:hypothetical protein